MVSRNQAVGTCSLVARIGGISALLLDNLKVKFVQLNFRFPNFFLAFHVASASVHSLSVFTKPGEGVL